MAVEARHLNLFPPQLRPNREMIRPIDANACVASPYNYNLQMGYGLPLSGTTTVDTTGMLPMYSSPLTDSLPPKTPLKSDSGLTHNMPLLSRKRSREYSSPNQILPYTVQHRDNSCSTSSFSFLGEDISLQIEQQQLDIDHLIAQHMDKVRLEIEQRRKNQARKILEVIEERLVKRLRSKEDEIEKIAKMNWALEERIKSLCVENQIWRDLAQANEATANALRTNLEQVLSHVKDDVFAGGSASLNDGAVNNHHPLADDAESCCDSSGAGYDRAAGAGPSRDIGAEVLGVDDRRWCRSCRREEARVLLLPCRHLCLCTVCGSSLHTCPVCNSAKTASVHVNVS
ncbi:probable BOI-related E3 ubiquitin-protein ligase 3 [Punica granatum]|uniref:RING-type domain-containing protein n=2 Tax=Punica granatum TaxID=22663 RepID=A0A218X7Z1_PUNGR|nr:probable BOI-related E3 ubiquitin-protein ligase 3 [Punica granatum]OWM81053.1 hypothetical protein CDL15_Pgr007084 [Punica granatum]PKI47683.1 hypothetical protein CRG98_031969 [Punica granatum]